MTPPNDIEAEKHLLGIILGYPEMLIQAKSLNLVPESFFVSAHAAVYRAILELSAKDVQPDMVSLFSYFQETGTLEQIGGPSTLAEIPASYPSANFDYLARKVISLHAKRELIKNISKGTEEATSHSDDTENTLQMLSEGLEKVRGILAPKESFKRAQEAQRAFLDRLSDDPNVTEGVKTGIEGLDEHLSGMRPGELWVTAGPTSSGKSALSIQLACAQIKEGKTALIFSLEMDTEEVFARMASHLYKVEMDAVMRNRPLNKGDVKRLKEACEGLADASFAIADTPGMTLENIEALSQQYAQETDIDAIVVDYVQLIEGARLPGENREQQLSRYVKRLKQLAKRHECTVITPSQLNDDGKVRESREIANSANVLIFIGDNELTIGKNRNGPRGQVGQLRIRGQIPNILMNAELTHPDPKP